MIEKDKKITLGIIIDTALKIPPYTGVTYRLYFLSKKLSQKGICVKIFLCNRNINDERDLKNLFDDSKLEFHIIPEKLFYNPKRLEKVISDNRIDIIQFEDSVSVIRFSQIAEHLKIPVCLEMHDVEATLKKFLGFKNTEVQKTRKISHEACKIAEKIICMTSLDSKELVHKIGVDYNKINIVSNPIDLSYFPYFGPNINFFNIIFVGNMFYWPNQKAAKKIIELILPKITEKTKKVKLYFVGIVPDDFKCKYQNNQINFTGPVNDLNKYLKLASIALCPVFEGSGMKVKILNYCAAGLPIITTKIGSSGYEQIKSLIVENNINKYSDIILNLFFNKKRLKNIGRKNRLFVEKYFDLEKISLEMASIYKKIIDNYEYKKKYIPAINLPLPLWLKENRINKISNRNYYIIKNGKVILKKKIT
jgi:glycosyltransferase involved in cell wall biosynthesis